MRNAAIALNYAASLTTNEIEARMAKFQYSSIIWLTQNKYTIVDNEDYDNLSKFKWHLMANPKRTIFYPRTRNTIVMSRYLLNAPRGIIVDHINHNGLDNRKSNLRFATSAQNQSNKLLNDKNTSGYKGVCVYKRGAAKRFVAKISADKKKKTIGYYTTPQAAAAAYDKAAMELHGEFALTNKMLGLL